MSNVIENFILKSYNIFLMGEVILDAFLDSLKILAVLVIFNIIIALIEPKLSDKIKLKGKLAPLIGVSVSLLPQCGFSVVATDLYQKRHITIGTLIGIYLATSDEAIPIFLAYPDKALHILPFIALKFLLGLIFGYLIDFIFYHSRKRVEHHLEHCNDSYKIRLTHCESAEKIIDESQQEKLNEECDCDDCKTCECHNENVNNDKPTDASNITTDNKKNKKSSVKRYLLSPVLHSLEIFSYVLVVNILFGILIYYIGEDKIISFLVTNKYIAPLFAVIVGAIPNCVSSVVLSELYIMGGLGFGAALGGLCMNAGLGFIMLFKKTKQIKNNLFIIALMFVISIFISYIFSLIFNFDILKI